VDGILAKHSLDINENFPDDIMFDKLTQVLFYKPRSKEYFIKFMKFFYLFDNELNDFKVSHVERALSYL
jgi:hypothetical protein